MNAIVKELTRDNFAPSVDLTEKELRSYSLLRAIRAQLSGNWQHAGLELEISQALAAPLNKEVRGVMVPFEVLRAPPMGFYKPGEGQELASTVHMGDEWHLRGQYSGCIIPYATVLNNLTGVVSLPIIEGGGATFLSSEDTERAESAAGTDQITLEPHILGSAQGVSRRLLKQSDPSVDDWFRRRFFDSAMFSFEMNAVAGSGTNGVIRGVTAWPDVPRGSFSMPPTWAELTEAEAVVLGGSTSLTANYHYVTGPDIQQFMKVTERAAGSNFTQEGGICNGYPVRTHRALNSIPRLLFGNWQDAVCAFWGGMDIVIDRAAHAEAGGVIVRGFIDCDFGVLNPASFTWDSITPP